MRTGLDLDDRRDPVLLDASDDPREAVARGLRDDRSIAALSLALSLQAAYLRERDEPLAAR